ncbi:15-hydroxyprostaglandin dehydrogenase [NAD(+)]-like isoform X1 [Pieris brassicae]|uniref:15-hydroxyprostaglandin dehydrogenase [NAD(+)] n=1 Tax=Pieris brassicae TaxID=7116 RepID=A0A9P0SN49_PIEBR|nr:15-hydroxyprostaglandin dehydrogenase [NAD(+)]-like isoform X1 [Pieris brassicae]CAH3894050.1 unnamed protein product [Pieris brassicae]
MVWSVDNKVVLVTGGAAGVGAGLVRELLARNAAHVAFLDVAVREGAALENELLNKFGALRAKFIKCDITKEGELSEAYKQVHDKYRRLDVVVNNAGIVGDNEMSREIIDVNFCGTVTSTLKALSIMRADVEGSGGAVINVSSSHAFKPSSLSVYNATKAAVLQFTNFLAGDESGMKVRIITVCLGPTDTALLHKRNLNNFATDAHGLTSEPQRVESAVNGIIEVMQRADNGTTWMISNNDMARDVTRKVRENLKVLSEISEPL